MDANRFGAFIATLRREQNMTQAQLAVLLRVTDKAVSRWERGLGFPDVGTLLPLSRALGVSISELMNAQKSTATAAEKKNMAETETCNVKSARVIGDIIGYGRTEKWGIWGTDLGIPVYSPKRKRMYFLFGEAHNFGKSGSQLEGNKSTIPLQASTRTRQRGTVAGYITDFDLSNGVKWAGFLHNEDGSVRVIIRSHRCNNLERYERSKVSQGGIEIDGTLYIFYESVRDWDPMSTGFQRSWRVNYTGVVKSTDGGETFERVHDLSWVETDRGEFASTIKELAEQDMDFRPSGFDLDLSSHVAPGFAQTCAVDGKDGYVYIYGRRGGRHTGIKVGRVKRRKIEIFSEYEYLTGYENGEPVWIKGLEGLNIIHQREPECDIVQSPCSNMSVHYNAYLQRWVLVFYRVGVGIMYSVAETPYGVYSEPRIMLSIEDPRIVVENSEGGNMLYGGFAHELLNREGGRRTMVVISQWSPKFLNSMLIEVTFE